MLGDEDIIHSEEMRRYERLIKEVAASKGGHIAHQLNQAVSALMRRQANEFLAKTVTGIYQSGLSAMNEHGNEKE